MEQDVDTDYRVVCCTCLSSGRNLLSLNNQLSLYQMFRLLMYDFAGDRFGDTFSEMEQLVCWECVALLKKVLRFKRQVHSAQEHLRVLAMSQEAVDHTYLSQSLSPLSTSLKVDYDEIFIDYTLQEQEESTWDEPFLTISNMNAEVKSEQFERQTQNNISLDIDSQILQMPHSMTIIENPITGMSHIVVESEGLVTPEQTYTTQDVKTELLNLGNATTSTDKVVIYKHKKAAVKSKQETEAAKCGYFTEVMSEEDLLAYREELKQRVPYASAYYKCELCIIGFYTQQQVEDHFVSHKPLPPVRKAQGGEELARNSTCCCCCCCCNIGTYTCWMIIQACGFPHDVFLTKEDHSRCTVCYLHVPSDKLESHLEEHYTRYICKRCGHIESGQRIMALHVRMHDIKPLPPGQLPTPPIKTKKDIKKEKRPSSPPKPGILRKLLSKTTIEGYKCLECDMFFTTSRARSTHVARYHREGLQCDHCKKRFVNRNTLITHLRLHEGPLPRSECPICHKMVRDIQIKYHIQRHQNITRYTCTDCDKVFSHLATYQAHLKYARAHASDNVFKFPCPMCNKGYPTKEQMQDHFNYNHLGKTTHKCPVCDKPIASQKNVERHLSRVHGRDKRKEKPRPHSCHLCGKTFTDKKALNQHLVIHSGERPLSCEVCHQTFKQKASLYTHRKRVHKLFPQKKNVEFMPTEDGS